jgi:hypothetical protein
MTDIFELTVRRRSSITTGKGLLGEQAWVLSVQ